MYTPGYEFCFLQNIEKFFPKFKGNASFRFPMFNAKTTYKQTKEQFNQKCLHFEALNTYSLQSQRLVIKYSQKLIS